MGAPRARAASPQTRNRGLDGIRAIAVVAVMLYHAGVSGVNGGLLGVDVFFVLSGFLITSLLCTEFVQTGGIRLGHFWARRGRRLLPALFLLLIGVAVYAWAFRNSLDVAAIRGDAIATIFFFANWHFLLTSQGYFAQGANPSPLLHMWSLGVEEQYYLIWPGIAVLVLRWKGIKALAWTALAGACSSAALMGILHATGSAVERLYYGTDTRAQSLLVGSLLGALASKQGGRIIPESLASNPRIKSLGIAATAAGGLILLWALHSWNGNGSQPLLYTSGFLLVAVATGTVIVFVTNWPSSFFARVLSLTPVAYIGRISYGLYLYHWPLFLVLNGANTGLSGAYLLIVRFAATLAAAMVSFHFVEEPFRRGSFVRAWRGVGLAAGSAMATVAIVLVATVTPTFASIPPQGSANIPPQERAELTTADAFTTSPIRFLLLGDSVAYTAGWGLAVDSVKDYGVDVMNQALLGCDLTRNSFQLSGVTWGVTPPSLNCGSWQKTFKKDLKVFHPQVVGLLIGRFELTDALEGGKWVHVGEPKWDSVLLSQLKSAVRLLGSTGAKVVLYTFPYVDPPQEQANGSLFPENAPARVDSWNDLVRQAARDNPGTSISNLNQVLDPAGHYTSNIDGYNVRWPDGVHVSGTGGEWLRSKLLPQVAALGLAQRGVAK